MTNKQLAERMRIAIDVQAKQLVVGVLATVARGGAWLSGARFLLAARVGRDAGRTMRCVAGGRLTLRGQPPLVFPAARA